MRKTELSSSKKKTYEDQRQLVLAAPKARAEGRVGFLSHGPASLFEEALKELSYARYFEGQVASKVEELQQKNVK